ncbi:MAG TPA: hypothetical protein VMH28_22230 [Candidatus Acidoferrales bacterium]|nr:hypothetical protein [Candidatus Acidoferrales bacterium]
MNSLTSKLMITAAAVVAATSIASAQSLKADIPFAFRAGGKVMSPGTYKVTTVNSTHYIILANYQAKDSVIAMPTALANAPKNGSDPVITFECGRGPCELVRLWTAAGYPAMTFAHGKSGSANTAALTDIRLVRTNGD